MAPPLEPSYKRSRVRSLPRGREHTTSAEFFWDFDAVSGDSFAVILRAQREQGRDVFGLSPKGCASVRAAAWKRWDDWKRSQHAGTPATKPPVVQPAAKLEVPKLKRVGRLDVQNTERGASEATAAETEAAIAARMQTGFRRLNVQGEKWKPGTGVGVGEGTTLAKVSPRQLIQKAAILPVQLSKPVIVTAPEPSELPVQKPITQPRQ
jgi:hypothetical protein